MNLDQHARRFREIMEQEGTSKAKFNASHPHKDPPAAELDRKVAFERWLAATKYKALKTLQQEIAQEKVDKSTNDLKKKSEAALPDETDAVATTATAAARPRAVILVDGEPIVSSPIKSAAADVSEGTLKKPHGESLAAGDKNDSSSFQTPFRFKKSFDATGEGAGASNVEAPELAVYKNATPILEIAPKLAVESATILEIDDLRGPDRSTTMTHNSSENAMSKNRIGVTQQKEVSRLSDERSEQARTMDMILEPGKIFGPALPTEGLSKHMQETASFHSSECSQDDSGVLSEAVPTRSEASRANEARDSPSKMDSLSINQTASKDGSGKQASSSNLRKNHSDGIYQVAQAEERSESEVDESSPTTTRSGHDPAKSDPMPSAKLVANKPPMSFNSDASEETNMSSLGRNKLDTETPNKRRRNELRGDGIHHTSTFARDIEKTAQVEDAIKELAVEIGSITEVETGGCHSIFAKFKSVDGDEPVGDQRLALTSLTGPSEGHEKEDKERHGNEAGMIGDGVNDNELSLDEMNNDDERPGRSDDSSDDSIPSRSRLRLASRVTSVIAQQKRRRESCLGLPRGEALVAAKKPALILKTMTRKDFNVTFDMKSAVQLTEEGGNKDVYKVCLKGSQDAKCQALLIVNGKYTLKKDFESEALIFKHLSDLGNPGFLLCYGLFTCAFHPIDSEAKGPQFFGMHSELCDGDVEEHLKKHRLKNDTDRRLFAKELFQQVCSAMITADKMISLRHNDLKLRNILCMKGNSDDKRFPGRYIITDFGTSTAHSSVDGQKITLAHIATVENMPFEILLRGSNAKQGRPLDSWRMALLLLQATSSDGKPYEEVFTQNKVTCPSSFTEAFIDLCDEEDSPYAMFNDGDFSKFCNTLYWICVLFGVDNNAIEAYKESPVMGLIVRHFLGPQPETHDTNPGRGRRRLARNPQPTSQSVADFRNHRKHFGLYCNDEPRPVNKYFATAQRVLEESDGLSLLFGLANLDPEMRLTIEDALKHPFVAGIVE